VPPPAAEAKPAVETTPAVAEAPKAEQPARAGPVAAAPETPAAPAMPNETDSPEQQADAIRAMFEALMKKAEAADAEAAEVQEVSSTPQEGASEVPTPPAPAPAPKPAPVIAAPTAEKPAADTGAAVDEKEIDVTITLPEEIEMAALIELVGKQLGLNYIYEPTDIKGKVTLKIHDGKIKVKDTYALLETVLKFKGLAMTRRGSLVTIVKKDQAMQMDPVIRSPDQPIGAGDVMVATVFQLKNITTDSAQNMLQSMQLGTTFNAIAETGTLIVMDYAYRMERIEQLLRMVDIPGKQRVIRERQLRYTVASKLAPKVQTMAEYMGTVSITISEGAPAPAPVPAPPAPGTPPAAGAAAASRSAQEALERARAAAEAARRQAAGKGQPAEDSVHLDTDDRTNRIFIIGREEKTSIVEGLIDTLDVPEQSLRTLKEYEIKYVDTTDVVTTLYELGVITSMPDVSSGTTSPGVGTSRQTTPRTPRPTPGGAAGATGGTASPDDPFISVRKSTNSLLINATEEQHEEISLVIAHIDIEQSDSRSIREYEIQHVDATEILSTLQELGIIPAQTQQSRYGTGSRYDSTTGRQSSTMQQPTIPRPGAAETPGASTPPPVSITGEPTTAEDITADYPQIAILEATNSLLVSATPRQHAAIALVISHVDREVDTAKTPFVVYPLQNQDPEELAGVLDQLVNATLAAQAAATAPTQAMNTQQTTTGAAGAVPVSGRGDSRMQTRARPSAVRSDEFNITIVPDLGTNSLIVYANKKNQQWISELIKKLDEYRAQVLLDVTLVEISKDNEFNIDLDLVSKYPSLTPGGSMTALTKPSTVGVTALVQPFPASQILEGSVTNGSGVAFYADQHIQALLKLMDKKNYGRVLARPSLLVKDNEEGTIKAEKKIYIGEEKTTITTPDQGQAITSADIQFKDYSSGITLTITPHIASGKVLQLEIELDRTDFDPSDPGTTTIGNKTVPKPLNTVSSNVGTLAVIPDGATIILGGIETMTQTKGVTKIPLFGDIPLIGALFRGIDETDVQSRLYVFVKANVIQPGDDLTGTSDIEVISQKKRDAFERDETNFQGLEAVPGIKPGKIQPEKILEDDEYIKELRRRQQEKSSRSGPTVEVQL